MKKGGVDISPDDLLWAYLYDADLRADAAANFGETAFPEGSVNRKIYDSIKLQIHQIVENPESASSTKFEVDLSNELKKFIDGSFTANDLGVEKLLNDNSISQEAANALMKKVTDETGIDLQKVADCLYSDCAAELFWRGLGYSIRPLGSVSYKSSEGIEGLSLQSGIVSITIDPSDAFKDSSAETKLDRSKLVAVNKAKAKAKTIVEENKGKSDYQKLLAYANTISDLVDYNYGAADSSTNTPYGNPWQMIWVFDEDEATKVVCEGYAKAFQYLCDLTEWNDKQIECYYISGYLDGGGHAWNIVRLGGKSYIVDVTNYDITNRENRFCLFLGGTTGSVDGGYVFTGKNTDDKLKYTYKPDTINLFGNDVLTLADQQYTEPTEEIKKTDISGTTVALAKSNVPYNGEEQKPVLTIKNGETNLIEGTDYTVDHGTNAYVDAGTYTITVTGTGNYEGSKQLTYEITKTDFTASAERVETKIGKSTQTDLSGILKDGMGISGAVSDNEGITCNVNGKVLTITGNKAGTGNITVSTTETDNYNAGTITVPVTISEKDSATLAIGALDKTYDGKAVTQPVIANVPNDAAYTWKQGEQTLPSAPKDVGTYKLIVTGEDADNIYTGEKEFTISARTVTPGIDGTAHKVYDGTTDFDNHYTLKLTGVVEGETVGTTSTGASTKTTAGNTTLTIRDIALTGDAAKNYTLSDTTLTAQAVIEKYTFTNVTAQDSNADYGTEFTLGALDGIPAFLENETANANLTVNWKTDDQAEPSDAGTYKYTVTIPETDNANEFTTAEATHTIRPADLPADPIDITISTKDSSKSINMADYISGLDGTITVPNDIDYITASGTVLTITPKEGATGTQQAVLTLDGAKNYNDTNKKITLNITFTDKETVEIDAADVVKSYDGKPVEAPVITAKRGDEPVEIDNYVFVWSTDDKNAPKDAGDYQLTITLPEESVYALTSPKIINVKIEAVPVTVKPTDIEIETGGAIPTEFDVTYTGFIAGEDAGSIIEKPAVWTCDADTAVAGEYQIALKEKASLKNGNYEFVYEPGKLIVKNAESSNPGSSDNENNNTGSGSGNGGNEDNNTGNGGNEGNNTGNGGNEGNNTGNGGNEGNNTGNGGSEGNNTGSGGSEGNNTGSSSSGSSSGSGSSGGYGGGYYVPQQPVQPGIQQPAQPDTQQPVQPDTQQPEQPDTQQPEQPNIQQPDTQTPNKPEKGSTIIASNGTHYEVQPVKKGEIPTVSYSAPPVSAKGTVKIPNTVKIDGTTYNVTEIAKNAFKDNKQITKVIIGNNIKTIGAGAFSGCNKISGASFGKEVTSIGKDAFKDCTKLKLVKTGNKVKTIGANAFSGCKSVTKITLGNQLTDIGAGAFSGCTKAVSIKLGSSLKIIGDNAFKNCMAVKSFTIPANVVKIGKTVFTGCSNLKTITVKTKMLTGKNMVQTTFKGVGTNVIVKVPKLKLNPYTRLFRSKGLSARIKVKAI